MVLIWEDIQTLTEEREAKLLDVMELAEKFWCDHMALVATIKDTQDFIRELEGPGVDPSVVKQQQEAAEVSRKYFLDLPYFIYGMQRRIYYFAKTKRDNCVEIYNNSISRVFTIIVSQESTVNNMYQCLIAVSMQHVLVITFPYLFVDMCVITISLRLLKVTHA